MDISHSISLHQSNHLVDAYIGNNKANVVVHPDGKTFKSISSGRILLKLSMLENIHHSHCVYYPSFQGTVVRYGVRLSISPQSRVLIGFVIYSFDNETFFFVLYDLYSFRLIYTLVIEMNSLSIAVGLL